MKKKVPSEKEVINDIVLGTKDPVKKSPDLSKARPVESAPETSENVSEKPEQPEKPEKSKKPVSTKKTSGIIMLIIGLFTLLVGAVLLIKTLTDGPAIADAEYLVEIGQWKRSDEPSVIWNFTEVGKGTLTTNNHTNDYDFIWALDSGELKIETSWLYTLNDSYNYKLDQSAKVLTLLGRSGEILYTFIPVATEATE